MAQLLHLESDSEQEIGLYINSPGGSFSALTAIYDTMQFVRCDIATIHHQADLLEDAQMLRDGRPAHGKPSSELADGARTGAEELEDLAPRRVAERVERMSVSNHLP